MDYEYSMVSEEERRRKALIGFYDYMTGQLITNNDIYLISHIGPYDRPNQTGKEEAQWTYVVFTEQSTPDRLDVFTVHYNKYHNQFIYELNVRPLSYVRQLANYSEELEQLRKLEMRLPGPSIHIDVTYDKDLYEDVFHD